MSQWSIAEFRCPEHGDFEALVEKPVPDEWQCPELTGAVIDGGPAHGLCDVICAKPSPWVISAPKPKILSVACTAAVSGGDTERRPGMLDTRPLAEGMPEKEWRKLQDKGRQERRHQQLIAKGLKTKRIQVG